MNDQLDERIHAFVAELVDDPPAIPSFLDNQVVIVPRRPDTATRPVFRRRLSGPVVAVTVFVTALALGAVVLVLRPAGPLSEVFTGLSTPTTHAASTETFLGVPIEPAVPFRASMRYEVNSETPDAPAYSASVGVFYLGPGVFRVEIESVDPEPTLEHPAGRLPGNYVVTNGAGAASFLAAQELFLRFPAGEVPTVDLGEFGWRHWADRCRGSRPRDRRRDHHPVTASITCPLHRTGR